MRRLSMMGKMTPPSEEPVATLYRDWLWAARARLAAALAYALLSIWRGRGAAQPFVDFHALDEGSVTWSVAWAG